MPNRFLHTPGVLHCTGKGCPVAESCAHYLAWVELGDERNQYAKHRIEDPRTPGQPCGEYQVVHVEKATPEELEEWDKLLHKNFKSQ